MKNLVKLLILVISYLAAMQICVAAEDELPRAYSVSEVDASGNKITRFGFMLNNGIRVTDAIYDRVYPFSSNGLALVNYNGLYGFIDAKGNYLVPLGLAEARPFDEYGLAAVRQKTKWGLINSKTEFVLNQIFDKIEKFQPNGLAIVKYEGKYGLVDTLGNVVLPINYDKIENFEKSGYAYIKSNNKFGIVDSNGVVVVAPEYKDKKKAKAVLPAPESQEK